MRQQRDASSRLAAVSRHIAPSHCAASSQQQTAAARLGIQIESGVRDALSQGLPVVALESTIISHGMPYPQNLHTAQEVERTVREQGVIPATIAILGGVPRVGLTASELQQLAELGPRAVKTARRDIAHVVSHGLDGATTVSATMLLASKVGIGVFVTGGIGGVHRHGETSMDVSSDLTELGRTPVAVVSAGVKSLLDVPRTLEYLETQGVTVVAYGTDEFPAFFTRSSGCRAPCRVDSPQECAALIQSGVQLELQSGVLVGVPIPEQHAAVAEPVEAAIQAALAEASEQGIVGRDVTPFLLKRVNQLTGGASLAANIHLVKNNARVGAQIAVALAQLQTPKSPPVYGA